MEGLSIFQSESIKLDTSLNRVEEEEANEDQKRRHQELGNQLANAFDDLLGDDDCTANSSAHFSYTAVDKEDHITAKNKNFKNRCEYDYMNISGKICNLKKNLESKCRENVKIKDMMTEMSKTNEELMKRLALAEAEITRAEMNNKQTHELLVESKTKVSDLENLISKLETKIKFLETTNNNLTVELERVQNVYSDAQHKYKMVQKNAVLNSDAEIAFKQSSERYKAQIDMMTQQISNLREKLDHRESEFALLDRKYKELQRNFEAFMVDKTETINHLSHNLKDSQKQCQDLLSKQECSPESIHLKRLVTALEQQIADMQKTIYNLTTELESTSAQLDFMNSALYQNGIENGSSSKLNLNAGNNSENTSIVDIDPLKRLKHELQRCIISQKTKREEIRNLQQQLISKNEEIKILKDEENAALVQINTYKDMNIRLESKLRILEDELKEIHKNKKELNKEKIIDGDLQKKMEAIIEENQNLKQELETIKTNYEICKLKLIKDNKEAQQKLTAQIKIIEKNFERIKQQNENLASDCEALVKENELLQNKNKIIELKLEQQKLRLNESVHECDRLKNLYVEISNSKKELETKLENLKRNDFYKENEQEKQKTFNLERSLELAELQTSEQGKLLELEKMVQKGASKCFEEKVENETANAVKIEKTTSSDCTKCIQYISEVRQLETQLFEVENHCKIYSSQILALKIKTKKADKIICDLKEKLLLRDKRDDLISELKTQARQLEDYIKYQNTSTNTSGICFCLESKGQQLETCCDFEENCKNKYVDHKIKFEDEQVFVTEMKIMGESFKLHVEELINQNCALKHAFQKMNSELKLRESEVQILKHAILSEREKFEEILKVKDIEAQNLFQQQNTEMQRCCNELQAKHKKLVILTKEMNNRNLQIDSERQSMKTSIKQWEDQKKIFDKRELDWKQITTNMRSEYEDQIEHWKAKYISAKKMAENYKKYAEEKESHMIQECERIKSECDISIRKIESKMRLLLEKHSSDKYAEEKESHMIQECKRIKSECDISIRKIESKMRLLLEKHSSDVR